MTSKTFYRRLGLSLNKDNEMTYPLPLSLEANYIYTLLRSKPHKGVLEALRDGQALEAVGLTDADQDAIEELESYLQESEG